MITSYASHTSQQSVHWTLGVLRHFQAFSSLRAFSRSQEESTVRPPDAVLKQIPTDYKVVGELSELK